MGQIVSNASSPIIIEDSKKFNFHNILIKKKFPSNDKIPDTIKIENLNNFITIKSFNQDEETLSSFIQNPNILEFSYPFLIKLNGNSTITFTMESDNEYIKQINTRNQLLEKIEENENENEDFDDANDTLNSESTENEFKNLIFKKLCLIRGKTKNEIFENLEQLKNEQFNDNMMMIGDVYGDDIETDNDNDLIPKFRFTFDYELPRNSSENYIYKFYYQELNVELPILGDFKPLFEFSVWIEPILLLKKKSRLPITKKNLDLLNKQPLSPTETFFTDNLTVNYKDDSIINDVLKKEMDKSVKSVENIDKSIDEKVDEKINENINDYEKSEYEYDNKSIKSTKSLTKKTFNKIKKSLSLKKFSKSQLSLVDQDLKIKKVESMVSIVSSFQSKSVIDKTDETTVAEDTTINTENDTTFNTENDITINTTNIDNSIIDNSIIDNSIIDNSVVSETEINFNKHFMRNNDGPSFKEDLEKMENFLVNFQPILKNYFKYTNNYINSINETNSIRKSYIEIITHFKKFLINNSINYDIELNEIFNEMVEKLINEQEYFENYKKSYESNLIKNLEKNENLKTIEEFENEFFTKKFNQQKKRYLEKQKDYYSWLNKYLSTDKSLIKKLKSNNNTNDLKNFLNNEEFLEESESSEEESIMISNSNKRLSFNSKRNSNVVDKDQIYLDKRKSYELIRLSYFNYLNSFQNGEFIEGLKIGLFKNLNEIYHFDLKFKDLKLIDKIKKINKNLKKINENYSIIENEKANQRILIKNAKNNQELESALNERNSKPINKEIKKDHEGILWTYGGGNKFGWHKQWVVLKNGYLYEYIDWKNGKVLRNPPIDLRFGCIKSSTLTTDRRFCFEIISTRNEHRMFQAVSQQDQDLWIKLLNNCLDLNNIPSGVGMSPVEVDKKKKNFANALKNQNKNNNSNIHHNSINMLEDKKEELDYLQIVRKSHPSNLQCCDCGSSKSVDWISISLLVVVCIDCSGVHRSLGSHLSKIRSLTLDISIFTPEIIKLLNFVNNENANTYWERNLKQQKTNLITPNSSPSERSLFIINKYKEKKYIENDLKVNSHLIYGIHSNNIFLILKSLACGGNPNMVVIKGKEKEIESSLLEYALTHYSGTSSNPIFEIAELLLLNGANCGLKVVNNLNLIEAAKKFWQLKIDRSLGISNNNSITNSNNIIESSSSHITNGISFKKDKKSSKKNGIHSYSISDLTINETQKKNFTSQIPLFSFSRSSRKKN